MALFRSMGARKDAVRGTTALEVRKGLAHLFTGAGVLPGATSPLVTGTAGWAYSVGKAGFVSTRGASDGVHLFGNDGTVTIGTTGVGSTVPAAPGAGLARIDIIWVSQPSASENSDTVSDATFGVASGTPTSDPLAPLIPTGALELARNTMTGGAGTTSTASAGNAIAQTAARAFLDGGIRRLVAPAVVAGDQGPVGTTDSQVLTSGSTQVRSPGGQVRLTLKMLVSGTVKDDVFIIRVRDGSPTGTALTGVYVAITNTTRTSALHVDSVAISAGVARTLYVTVVRSSGTGTITILPGTTLIVDEDPA